MTAHDMSELPSMQPRTSQRVAQSAVPDDFNWGEEERGPIKGKTQQGPDHAISEVVYEWANASSIHGVHYFLDYQHLKLWKRTLYLCVFLTSVGLLIWQASALFSTFFKYETVTSIQIETPRTLPFPEVTICNFGNTQATLKNSTGISEPKNEVELLMISQPLEEFIVYAYFGLEDVTKSPEWQEVVSVDGVCARFVTNRNVSRPGLADGLDVLMFLNLLAYDPDKEFLGIQLYVAHPGTTEQDNMPFTMAGPGTATNVAIKKTVIGLEVDAPWSRCTASRPANYTRNQCLADCYYKRVEEQCGCSDIWEGYNQQLEFCTADDEIKCLNSVYSDEQSLVECESRNKCAIPSCYEVVYDTKQSSLLIDDASGEFVRLHINYESILETRYKEIKEMTQSQLLAQLGGLVGLFLGFSAVTFFEILGDLTFLRLLPRLWGDRRMYGLGGKEN